MATAHFRTGRDQYIVTLDVNVVGTANAVLPTGTLVTLTAASGNVPQYITEASTVAAATHIIALNDESVDGNYIATDAKVYKPSVGVKTTVTTATGSTSTTVKRVALYPIFNNDDVIKD